MNAVSLNHSWIPAHEHMLVVHNTVLSVDCNHAQTPPSQPYEESSLVNQVKFAGLAHTLKLDFVFYSCIQLEWHWLVQRSSTSSMMKVAKSNSQEGTLSVCSWVCVVDCAQSKLSIH